MNWYKQSKRNYKKDPITDPGMLIFVNSLGLNENLQHMKIKTKKETEKEKKKRREEDHEREYEHMPA